MLVDSEFPNAPHVSLLVPRSVVVSHSLTNHVDGISDVDMDIHPSLRVRVLVHIPGAPTHRILAALESSCNINVAFAFATVPALLPPASPFSVPMDTSSPLREPPSAATFLVDLKNMAEGQTLAAL